VSNVNHANAKPESERPSSPPPLKVTDAKQKPMPMPIIEELAATVVPRTGGGNE
jgi:hypothetical protein